GPFAHVSLAVPGDPAQLTGQVGHVDTGAFKSVIPQVWADQLGLIRVREVQVEGLDGVVVVLPTYLLELTIKDLSPVVVQVLGSSGEQFVLLERDVLNRSQLPWDGPSLELTIQET